MPKRIALGASTLLVVVCACRAAELGQVTLLDLKYRHTGWYKHIRFIEQPDDWTFPYDYHTGHTYVRFEIFKFNTEVNTVGLHYCYFQDKHTADKHACTKMIKVHEPGVYYRSWQNSKMWQTNVIDWSRPLMNFMQIDNAVKGKGEADVRVTVIIVADGYKLRPPTDWDCPADWDCGVSCTAKVMQATANDLVKQSVEAGQLGVAWSAAKRDSSSINVQKAEQGQKVIAILDEYARERREALVRIKTTDPIRAVNGLAELAKMYAPSPKAREIATEVTAWNREEPTKRARMASLIFEGLGKELKDLKRRLRGKKASDPEAQRRFAVYIHDVRSRTTSLARKYPETGHARRAVTLCENLGISFPEQVVAAVRERRDEAPTIAAQPGPQPPVREPAPPPRADAGTSSAEESALSGAERAKLETWAAQARARTVRRIAEAVKAGARLHAYVEFGRGIRKGRVQGADENRLSVSVTGVSFPTRWDRLPPKRFHDLAMQVVGEGPAGALLDLAVVSTRAGHVEPIGELVGRLLKLGCPDRSRLELVERAARCPLPK